jgi:Response regulator containing CheY-like receiver and SARP domains
MRYVAVVIDNNQRELMQSVDLLIQSGAFKTVVPFEDVKEAIEYIDVHGCDVLFTEVEMKKNNGFDLVFRFGQSNLAMCFVFLTSNANYSYDAFKLHVTDFALKPIEPCVISRIIKKIESGQYFEKSC